ncbi:hypothetical protein [Streptomyces sp. NPDC047028]|uniref:hypothetical protein n=1 Tax=Streptomyces sp. NPDC047028 TaxID=3155793 RepID=UPI0033C40589
MSGVSMRARIGMAMTGACGAALVLGGLAAGPATGAAGVTGAAGPTPSASAVPAPPSADLAFHGTAVMKDDQVDVKVTPSNLGPAAVPDASVRLRWSVPLTTEALKLPAGCVRTDDRTVVCGTGALASGGVEAQIQVSVRLKDKASQVTLEVDTAWNGGATDKDHTNDQLKVLVLATGDAYAF